MSDEYISRAEALEITTRTCGDYAAAFAEIRKLPAADVVPVVHARWITRGDKGIISMTHPYMCSRCGRVEMDKEPYCNCGAKMDRDKVGDHADD